MLNREELLRAGILEKDQSTTRIICGVMILAALCAVLYLIF